MVVEFKQTLTSEEWDQLREAMLSKERIVITLETADIKLIIEKEK